jgi:hypothetical protein
MNQVIKTSRDQVQTLAVKRYAFTFTADMEETRTRGLATC